MMTPCTARPLVVLATDSVAPSGVGEHMLTLAEALRDSHAVIVALPTEGAGPAFLKRAEEAGIPAKGIDGDAMAMPLWLQAISADLLHVHAGIAWEGHALANAGWMSGIPVIRTEHLPYVLTDDRQKEDHRLAIGLIDHTIFVSDSACETYRRTGATSSRFKTIRNGIARPNAVRSRSDMRDALHIPEEQLVVMTVARFTPQKGYRHLIAAAARILEHRRDISFVLVGDGPQREPSERLATDLGITASVRFVGERADVPDLLATADLFVLASLFEGLPLVVLEAMAIGLPVVATRIGGTSEALGKDYPWLVDPGNEGELADVLGDALRDEGTRRHLGERNRLRFEAEFTAARMAAETAALYRSVLAERTLAR